MCVWGWCVVLSLRSRVTPKQPPLQLHWHCAVRHRPDTDMVGHHDRASTLGIRHLQPLVDPEQVAGSAGRDRPLHGTATVHGHTEKFAQDAGAEGTRPRLDAQAVS